MTSDKQELNSKRKLKDERFLRVLFGEMRWKYLFSFWRLLFTTCWEHREKHSRLEKGNCFESKQNFCGEKETLGSDFSNFFYDTVWNIQAWQYLFVETNYFEFWVDVLYLFELNLAKQKQMTWVCQGWRLFSNFTKVILCEKVELIGNSIFFWKHKYTDRLLILEKKQNLRTSMKETNSLHPSSTFWWNPSYHWCSHLHQGPLADQLRLLWRNE